MLHKVIFDNFDYSFIETKTKEELIDILERVENSGKLSVYKIEFIV